MCFDFWLFYLGILETVIFKLISKFLSKALDKPPLCLERFYRLQTRFKWWLTRIPTPLLYGRTLAPPSDKILTNSSSFSTLEKLLEFESLDKIEAINRRWKSITKVKINSFFCLELSGTAWSSTNVSLRLAAKMLRRALKSPLIQIYDARALSGLMKY